MACLKDMTFEELYQHRSKNLPLYRAYCKPSSKRVEKWKPVEYTEVLNYILNHSKQFFTNEEEAEQQIGDK